MIVESFGSVISRGGSLLYIFIAANASPTVGFLIKKNSDPVLACHDLARVF